MTGPGRCPKCENPIVNGGHEWCLAWARTELALLRLVVEAAEADPFPQAEVRDAIVRMHEERGS